jgi:low temperature requirement protein LtrA
MHDSTGRIGPLAGGVRDPYDPDMATPRRARVEAGDQRAAVTTLELFFDLVFVFALTQITDLMAEKPDVEALVRGTLLLGVLWWCWTGYAWLGNVARADEGIVRLSLFAVMGAVFVAAITIPEAFDDGPGGLSGPVVFAFCYLAVRVIHLAIFWIASAGDRQLRTQLLRFVPSLVTSTVLLLLASQFTGLVQTLLWFGALAGDYLGTQLAGSRWRLVSPGHFAERHGLIVMVALGESIVATGIGIAQIPVSLPIIVAVLLGLTVSAALWWTYFDVTMMVCERALAAASGERQIRLARVGYSFLHLPMIIGVIMMSLGLKKALGYVAGVDEHVLADPLKGIPLAALFGGVALYLLALTAFKRYVAGSVTLERVVAAVLLLALAPLMPLVPALVALTVLTAVLVALAARETHRFREVRHHIRHSEH